MSETSGRGPPGRYQAAHGRLSAAERYGLSRRRLHPLPAQFRAGGDDSAMSGRPRATVATTEMVRARAQQHERARPMAGLFVTHVATHLRPMSRLITTWQVRDS